jgi:hypothetical protein
MRYLIQLKTLHSLALLVGTLAVVRLPIFARFCELSVSQAAFWLHQVCVILIVFISSSYAKLTNHKKIKL